MSAVSTPSPSHREPELLAQTVVVIGGSAGMGFETARRARAEGAKVILTGRNAERRQQAAVRRRLVKETNMNSIDRSSQK